MVKKLDWDKAKIINKPRQNITDEREFLDNDRAARWLADKEAKINRRIKHAVRNKSKQKAGKIQMGTESR